MSRINTTGINPQTHVNHPISYGWDDCGIFGTGYFFQVWDLEDNDKTIVNEGFVRPISESRLKELANAWSVKLKTIKKERTKA